MASISKTRRSGAAAGDTTMGKHFTLPTDLKGNPYTPVRSYSWLTDGYRSECARQMGCAPSEVEFRLDARAAMDAYAAERHEREDGMTHRRPGARALTQAERVF
jgi:hypothetical protein